MTEPDRIKLAITGSRNYHPLERVRALIRAAIRKYPNLSLLHGNARGVDIAARDEAFKWDCHVVAYPADWDKFGKVAGFRRNGFLVHDAHHVVAFWDSYSRGTAHAITLAARAGKLREVYGPDGKPFSSLDVAIRRATEIYEQSAYFAAQARKGDDFQRGKRA